MAAQLEVVDRGIIFDARAAPADARSCAFTSEIRLADGTLLVGFRNATARDSPDGGLRLMRSRDQAETWEPVAADFGPMLPGGRGVLYSGYLAELTPGRLTGSILWVDRSDPALSLVNPVTTGILPTRALLAESSDGGERWRAVREVELRPQAGCTTTGPLFRLANGQLSLPYESWKAYDDAGPGRHYASLRRSADQGRTWEPAITVGSDPERRFCSWDQRIATHPETGRLVSMFWTHDRTIGRDLDNHIAWGTADGTGWSAPRGTGLPGQHCQPIALGGDRLLAVYVHRAGPPGLRAVLSEDFGRTWQREHELVFYEHKAVMATVTAAPRSFEDTWQDMPNWWFGHPRGMVMPDGSVFVASYAGEEAATSMYWVRIRV